MSGSRRGLVRANWQLECAGWRSRRRDSLEVVYAWADGRYEGGSRSTRAHGSFDSRLFAYNRRYHLAPVLQGARDHQQRGLAYVVTSVGMNLLQLDPCVRRGWSNRCSRKI